MHTFTDKMNREWKTPIDMKTLRILKLAGAPNITDMAILSRIDVTTIATILGFVTEAEREAAGISVEEFEAGLDGDALAAGVEAMLLSVADFLPTEQGNSFRVLIDAGKKIEQLVHEETLRLLNAGIPPRQVEEIAKQALAGEMK